MGKDLDFIGESVKKGGSFIDDSCSEAKKPVRGLAMGKPKRKKSKSKSRRKKR